MRLTLLLRLDLSLDSLPVDLDLLVKLLEPIIGLLLLVLLEEALPIGDNRVNMGLLGNSNIEGLVPLVHLDVHFDGPVEQACTHQDLLSFVSLLAVER